MCVCVCLCVWGEHPSCNHICPKALMDVCGQDVQAHSPAHIGDGTCHWEIPNDNFTLGKSEHHLGIFHCNLRLPTGKHRYMIYT